MDGPLYHIIESPMIDRRAGWTGSCTALWGEVMAICRAHVAALGGNALVAYQMSECVVEDNLHKNQVLLPFVASISFTVLYNASLNSWLL